MTPSGKLTGSNGERSDRLKDVVKPAHVVITLLCSVSLWSCSPPPPLPKGSPDPLAFTTPSEDSAATPVAQPETITITKVAPDAPVSAEVGALARELTANVSEERDKALALYRWIAQNLRYDIAAARSKNYPDPDPDKVLKSRSAVCEGYSRLFSAMANEVGLEAVLVPGYSKGFSSDDDSPKSEPDHAWNAVKIDGQWQLLDTTWGSGHSDESGAFISEYSEDWFLVPPEQFATSHLPEDAKWQLLSEAMGSDAFWKQPTVSPLFFRYGLQLRSHPDGVIRSDGPTSVLIEAEEECHLMATLLKGEQEVEGATLVERRGGEFSVAVTPPEAGDYSLVIFCGPVNETRASSAVSYRLRAQSGQADMFPKTLKSFADREVQLLTPRQSLHRGQSATIELEAPGATKMMAVMGERQVALENVGGARFRGEIVPEGDEVGIFGSFDESNSYDGLLKYSVKP